MYLVLNIIRGDQIKSSEMGRSCGAYGEEEKYIQGFGGRPGVGGLLLRWISKKKWDRGVYWIGLS